MAAELSASEVHASPRLHVKREVPEQYYGKRSYDKPWQHDMTRYLRPNQALPRTDEAVTASSTPSASVRARPVPKSTFVAPTPVSRTSHKRENGPPSTSTVGQQRFAERQKDRKVRNLRRKQTTAKPQIDRKRMRRAKCDESRRRNAKAQRKDMSRTVPPVLTWQMMYITGASASGSNRHGQWGCQGH